jgi:hypothetical protein
MTTKPRVSLFSIAKNINEDWSLEDWLQWPPDAFALFSIIINRTGLYKYFLLDTDWWQKGNWSAEINDLSDKWINVASNRLQNPDYEIVFLEKEPLQGYLKLLHEEWDNPAIEIDQLRVLGNIYEKERERHRRFIQAVLYFAVVADVTCGGLGFLGQPLGPQKFSHRLFMGVANLLLNNTGTLSTISKSHGVVLPKMRTPQGGMTVRSMTHHLTFHTTEAEVIWRTFPLLLKDKNELNILAVPYPYEIMDDDLIPMPDDSQAVRYFEPKVKGKPINYDFIRSLVEWIGRSAKDGQEIDIVVLPEMALSYDEYTKLLKTFEIEFLEKKRCKRLPIIVTGITKENSNEYGVPSIDDPYQNEARIAVFFADQWYTTTQRKHHRWQLNDTQVKQYELEASFPGNKLWFEYCTASQRRMTVMAPNSELALTALICEDLAQQEPVSEIIRGIGPSLLLALLSDGPQLTSRWSARYAGVLASDPGTAVLSLTSLGMAIRSKNLDDKAADPILRPGLWKDLNSNTKDLEFKGDERNAFLFKITSAYKEEYTFDGRSDGKSSSYLHWIDKESEATAISFPKIGGTTPDGEKNNGTVLKEEFESLRELSALQFAIDGIVEVLMDRKLGRKASDSATKLFLDLLTGAKRFNSPTRKFRGQIFLNMKNAWENPHLLGISATPPENYKESMGLAVKDLEMIIDHVRDELNLDIFGLYNQIIGLCQHELKIRAESGGDKRTFMSVLYNLSNRLNAKDRQDQLILVQFGMTPDQINELQIKNNRSIDVTLFKS